MAEPDDAELLALSHRKPEKFVPVWDRHAAVVYRFIAARVGRTAAEELLGDVRHRAFRQRTTFDSRGHDAGRWFVGIAKNVLHEKRRTRDREGRALERLGLLPAVESPTDDVDQRLYASWALGIVERVVQGLPPGERDVVFLLAYEDRSYAETAEALGIPMGTVGSRAKSARQKLRDALEAASNRAGGGIR